MKIVLLLACGALLMFAQKAAPPESSAPKISDAAEKVYRKSLAIHNALDAHLKGSYTSDQRGTSEAMDKQERDIDAAVGVMTAECGEKFQLDREQFKKGVFLCAQKPEPVKPPAK